MKISNTFSNIIATSYIDLNDELYDRIMRLKIIHLFGMIKQKNLLVQEVL